MEKALCVSCDEKGGAVLMSLKSNRLYIKLAILFNTLSDDRKKLCIKYFFDQDEKHSL
jgi:hypothetical protein